MNKAFCKAVSWLLCLIMVISIMPASFAATLDYDETLDDYYKVITKKDYDLAPGIVESEIVLNNDAGTHRQVAHVVEVDLNNEYTKVIPSYKGMIPKAGSYGTEVMSKQAAYAEANGYGNVVAAMNLSLSWYDSAYYLARPELVGEPLGYMILDGVQYTNSQGKTAGAQTCVVVNFDEKDGQARPADMPKVQIRSTADAITGWEEQVIPANFGFLVKDGKNQYSANHTTDPASRSFVGVKADGTFVMVMNDGRQSPYSAGFNSYEMAQFMLSLGCVQAVNGDGGGSSAFLSQRPGEDLKINCSPSDGAERATTHGILVISTAPATGEFVRASISSEYDYYTPGSVVEFSAIGSDLVGTAADIPENVTWQLADTSFGTIENGVFTSNGKEGDVTVQMVYDGNVVGEDTIHIVWPDEIAFAQTNMVIPFGKKVNIVINASYNSKIVCIKPADVKFVLSNNVLGSIDGFSFSAAPEGTEVEPGTLSATIGELTITANLSLGKGSDIVYDFEDQNITDWSIKTNYPQYGPKGSAKDANGNYYYNGQNELGEIHVVDSKTGKVRNGDYALAVECDFTQIYETGYHALNLRFPAIDTTDALKVGFWIYVPYDARHAQFTIAGGGIDNGELFKLCEGWHYVTAVPRTDNKFQLVNISIDDRACASTGNYYDYINEPNLNGKYTFYIDDITIDYSTAVEDRENPVFQAPTVLSYTGETSAALAGQTINFNTPTFEVRVADFTADNATGLNTATAKAYIDGKEVECTYVNGKITTSGDALADGVHTVKFEISDNAGNSSWTGGNINVVANTESSTVKVVARDPDADRLLVGSIYWLDVVASDVETIEKVEMTFDLNNASYWELEGMTAAKGFKAEWSVQEDDNIATITLSKNGTVGETGEAVIASIPVRTWESHITEYEGYEDQTPATLVSRGIIWAQSIEIALERGIITYVDGYTDETIGTFGMENILVDTELFFTNYSRGSVTGAQAWINAKKAAGVGFHEHNAVALEDKEATCTEAGYTGRTFCEECASVVEWGTTVAAKGHTYDVVDGKLTCVNGGELFNGVHTDGKTYVDGVVVDGWNAENTSYYKDGVKLTGPYVINGVVHTFDENGIYQPDAVHYGFVESDNGRMFFNNNKDYITGHAYVLAGSYYFDENGIVRNGEYDIAGEKVTFKDGQYVGTESEDVLLAGWAGPECYFVLYDNGDFYLSGSGEMYYAPSHANIPWYVYKNDIKKVYVGKDITELGRFSFRLCFNIVSITFEEGCSIERIERQALHYLDDLTSFVIPKGVKKIEYGAFGYMNNLSYVWVPDGVTSIDDNAFLNLKPANITLAVAEGTYAHDWAVKHGFKIELREKLPVFIAGGNCGESLTWELYDTGILYINGEGEMPDYSYQKYGENVAPWSLLRGEIDKIVIGAGVTKIGTYAFYNCTNLSAVEFAEGATLATIGEGAFGYTTALKTITLPASLESIGKNGFYFSGLETVDFEENSKLTTLGDTVFRNCTSLTSLYIPDGVTKIGGNLLYACGEQVVMKVPENSVAHKYAVQRGYKVELRAEVPVVEYSGACGEDLTWELYTDGVLYINGEGEMPDYSYANYREDSAPWSLIRGKIEKVVIGAGVTKIGTYAFYNCTNLSAVEFAEGATLATIGEGAFGYTAALKTITLPASLESIGKCGFYFSGLETVDFEENSKLTTLGDTVFRNCTSLTSVYVPDGVTKIGGNLLYACGEQVVMKVPENSVAHKYAVQRGYKVELRAEVPVAEYSGACGEDLTWELYTDGVLYINGEGEMPDYSFANYREDSTPWSLIRGKIKKVVIGAGVTKIGTYAFYNCTNLSAVEFAEGATLATIGEGAFGYTAALKTITLPASLESIGKNGFYFSGLETVAFEENSKLTTLGDTVFRNCTSLTSVYIPDGVTGIGYSLYHACDNVISSVAGGSFAHTYMLSKGYNCTTRA